MAQPTIYNDLACLNLEPFDERIDNYMDDIEQNLEEIDVTTISDKLKTIASLSPLEHFQITTEDSFYYSHIKLPCPACRCIIQSGKRYMIKSFLDHIKIHFDELQYWCPFYASNCCRVGRHQVRVLKRRALEERLINRHFKFKRQQSLDPFSGSIPSTERGECIPCGLQGITAKYALYTHWNVKATNDDVNTICPMITVPVTSYTPQDPDDVPLLRGYLRDIRRELRMLRDKANAI